MSGKQYRSCYCGVRSVSILFYQVWLSKILWAITENLIIIFGRSALVKILSLCENPRTISPYENPRTISPRANPWTISPRAYANVYCMLFEKYCYRTYHNQYNSGVVAWFPWRFQILNVSSISLICPLIQHSDTCHRIP